MTIRPTCSLSAVMSKNTRGRAISLFDANDREQFTRKVFGLIKACEFDVRACAATGSEKESNFVSDGRTRALAAVRIEHNISRY